MKPLKSLIKRLVRSVARFEPMASWLERPAVRARLLGLPGGHLLCYQGWERRHPFDLAHGSDTSGIVPVSDLGLETDLSAHAVCYAGSQPGVVRQVLQALPDLRGFSFVDLGCGKGRVLMVASEFPFQRVVGVELSAPLADLARRNVALLTGLSGQRAPIDVLTADAGSYVFPSGDLVVYLYNPFGAEVVEKVVAGIGAALQAQKRCVYVVYYNPVAGHCFDASPVFQRRLVGMYPYAPEELGFGPDTEDPVIVWQAGDAPAAPAVRSRRIEVAANGMRVRLVEEA